LVSKVYESVGQIDSAVHCAYPRSKGWGTRFEDLQDYDLFQDLNMQLGGAIIFSQRILRCFQEQGHGNLIHLSSIQGVRAPKFEHYAGTLMSSPVEYAAIKAGIISIVRWLAKYSANNNIRVNCVSPGGILDAQPEEFLRHYRESCTNIGMLSAEQVATTIIFLLSPSSAAINGQNIIIDDGWSL
jgi:NAD(P)-dependent dehydrogenase (short-subunit alcohol dehydrogenase family)